MVEPVQPKCDVCSRIAAGGLVGLDSDSIGTSTDPVSVEWRLTSYRERSDAAPPPTLCRWGDDCQAIAEASGAALRQWSMTGKVARGTQGRWRCFAVASR